MLKTSIAIAPSESLSSQDSVVKVLCPELMTEIVESLSQVVFLLDLDTREPIYSNRNLAKELGYDSEDLEYPKAMIPQELLHEHDRVDADLLFAKFKALGINDSIETEIRLIDKGGQWRNFSCRFVKQNCASRNSQPVLMAVLTDITIFKEFSSLKEQQARTACLANTAKTDFISQISHEIRNPIQGVCGFVDLLLSTELNDEQIQYAHSIRTASTLLKELVSDVLDISKIESGKIDIYSEEFCLVELVENATRIFGESTATKNIGFQVSIGPTVHKSYLGDKNRIRQIVYNFLSNSVKFTNCGSIAFEVGCLSSHSDFDKLSFKVKDTGIGIPKNMMTKVFDKFQQVSSNPYKSLGSGLGLTIVGRLANAMNATVNICSELNEGSEFELLIDLPRASDEKVIPEKVKLQYNTSKIYILTDEPKLAKSVCQTLSLDEDVIIDVALPIDQSLIENQDDLTLIICNYRRESLERCLKTSKLIKGKQKIAIVPQDSSFQELQRSKELYEIHSCIPHPVNYSCLINFLIKKKQEMPSPYRFVASQEILSPVLVIDDSTENLLLVSKAISKFGGQAITTTNGLEAINLIEQHGCSIAILDCMMPKIDGPQIAAMIREKWGSDQVKIIGLTGSALDKTKKQCLDAGMDDVWLKPVNFQALKKLLRT